MPSLKKARSKKPDYEAAFYHAPVSQIIVEERVIVDCNHAFEVMFGGDRAAYIGSSAKCLYPTPADFEDTGSRVVPSLSAHGVVSDDRMMMRANGDIFWVHVMGYTFTPHDPHQHTLWAFTALPEDRHVLSERHGSMTPRERDIAALLTEGKTGKEIGRQLGISPRTVDIYRSRLLRKFSVNSTRELVKELVR